MGYAGCVRILPGEASLVTSFRAALVAKEEVGGSEPFLFRLELDDWNGKLGRAYVLRDSVIAGRPDGVVAAAADRRLRIGETMLYDRMCPSRGLELREPDGLRRSRRTASEFQQPGHFWH